MKFGKKYSNMTVIMAMIQGIVIGVLGIIVTGVILLGTEGSEPVPEEGAEIPTAGPSEVEQGQNKREKVAEGLVLYAKQSGVFTSSEAAETFLKADSSLSTATVIEVDDQHFIWSAIHQEASRIELLLDRSSFKKAFTIERKSCSTIPMDVVWKIFQAKDKGEIKEFTSEGVGGEEKKFQEKMLAILAFTEDDALIKLHLLQYADQEGCVKISF